MSRERALAITVCRDLSPDIIHPVAYDAFRRLAHTLELDWKHGNLGCLFKPFETYRHPYRQADLYNTNGNKVTGARQYESAHQFGLAVDFVAYDNGRWSWDAMKPWGALKERAEAAGLLVPLEWDRCHVEHPKWQDYRACLRTM